MPCISPTCDVSDSSWPGSVSNSLGRKLSYHIPLSGALLPTFMPCRSGRPGGELRTGKITGNLQNYGLLRRFWQPVGETIQSLAAKFPEPSGVHPCGETQKLGTGCDGTRRGLRRSGLGPRLLVWLGGASRPRARPP